MSESDSPIADTVLMTIKDRNGSPSLVSAAEQLGVRVEDLDASFGVIPIDADRGLYAVQVRADRLPTGSEQRRPYGGPFANPKIGPIGGIDKQRKRKT